VKHYRPDENTNNSAISYYLKGEVVCALLDLTIRQATANQKSLDDVFRLLWQRYGDGRGVPEDGVEAAAHEATGVDLRAFFDRALRSTEELDYSPFQHVGLELKLRTRESPNDKGGSPPRSRSSTEERPRGWLGVSTKGSATIASVVEGSPASEGGLYPDDELIALDGSKIDASGLIARTDEKKPGDVVRITVFRRERLTELTCVLGQRPQDTAWLARVERPTDAQKAAFKAWLGATWEEPGAEATRAAAEPNRP
jgi:predicted metalloprotease with PDZ domain